MNLRWSKNLFFFAVAAWTTSLAQAANGILMKATNMTAASGQLVIARGAASVVIGELRFTADEIVYDASSGMLRFPAGAVIHSGNSEVTVKELTLDVENKRVFALSGNATLHLGAPTDIESPVPSFEFTREFPKSQTRLQRSIAQP